jgi:hypothetical protein
MKDMKLSRGRDEIRQSWTQMELKETCQSIDVHHYTLKRWQGKKKQLENIKVDLMSNSKRQTSLQHYHSILNGPTKEHIIILNVSLMHIPF